MPDFKLTWNESFKEYAVDIAKIYAHSPNDIINCLIFDSVCGSLNETYMALVKEKEIIPIEGIEQVEKERFWNLAKGLSEAREKRIMISRSIYLLEMLTK